MYLCTVKRNKSIINFSPTVSRSSRIDMKKKINIFGKAYMVTFGKFEDLINKHGVFYERDRSFVLDIGGTVDDVMKALTGDRFNYKMRMNWNNYVGQRYNRSDITPKNGKGYDITLYFGDKKIDTIDISNLDYIPIKVDLCSFIMPANLTFDKNGIKKLNDMKYNFEFFGILRKVTLVENGYSI